MDDTPTGSNNIIILLVGLAGSFGSFLFAEITASEVVDIWHFIPGLFSVAFITWRWITLAIDRKRKKEDK